jgi:hypothetical protein
MVSDTAPSDAVAPAPVAQAGHQPSCTITLHMPAWPDRWGDAVAEVVLPLHRVTLTTKAAGVGGGAVMSTTTVPFTAARVRGNTPVMAGGAVAWPHAAGDHAARRNIPAVTAAPARPAPRARMAGPMVILRGGAAVAWRARLTRGEGKSS